MKWFFITFGLLIAGAFLSGDTGLGITLLVVFLGIIILLMALVWNEGKKQIAAPSVSDVVNMSPSEYEAHVGRSLQEWGFRDVKLIGGTGDFGADVLCRDDGGNKVCVQCKKYSKPVGVSAVQEVIGARGFYGCSRAIVVTTVGYTPSARQLADRNGVELTIIN